MEIHHEPTQTLSNLLPIQFYRSGAATGQAHYAAGLMDKINRSIPLDREDKNALTHGVNNNSFFKRAIPVGGWAFDFSAVLKLFLVKQYGSWYEMWATDKTAVRAHVYGRIERIVEA